MLEYLPIQRSIWWHDGNITLKRGKVQLKIYYGSVFSFKDEPDLSRWERLSSAGVQGLAVYNGFFLVRTPEACWRYDDNQRRLIPVTLVQF